MNNENNPNGSNNNQNKGNNKNNKSGLVAAIIATILVFIFICWIRGEVEQSSKREITYDAFLEKVEKKEPNGRWMLFPSTQFWRYFAAKCLPAIVAISIVCIAITGFVI